MTRFPLLLASFGSGLLAACGTAEVERPGTAPLGADFGNAVHHNAAVHIIDPRPIHADDGAPALNGKRAAGALSRYENGAVAAPEAPSTSKLPD